MHIALVYADQDGCTLDGEHPEAFTMYLHVDHRTRTLAVAPRYVDDLVPCRCEAKYFLPDLPARRYNELVDDLAPLAELIIGWRLGDGTPRDLADAAKQQIIRHIMDHALWGESDAWVAEQLAG